ncbi:MAG: EAL domain-containing protein [Pseudomonadales bacterium]|nr:EAL domain-containing protein [Pseudomonadales bacterium]
MITVKNYRNLGCKECLNGAGLDFDFSMAFQPIVDVVSQTVFAQEALARGIGDTPAGTVFQHVNDDNRYAFDQACRVKAVRLASKLNISSLLSINFMPNAVYRPELCIRTTLAAAEEFDFPITRIMFEVTESEKVEDVPHLHSIISHYTDQGFVTALDDFGAGFSGLNTLADLDVDVLKIDMHLARDIHLNARKRAIVKGITATCEELGIKIIAEGVETQAEYKVLRALGITLFQGYLIARPTYEALAEIAWHNLI